MMRWWAVGAILLLAAPVQGADLELGPLVVEPEGPLAADTGVVTVTAPVSIDCQAALQWTGGGVLSDDVQLVFTSELHPEVMLSGTMTAKVPVAPCLEDVGRLEEAYVFSVRATQHAPGETPLQNGIGVQAHVGAATGPEEATASGDFLVEVAYWGLVSTNVSTTYQEGGSGATFEYPIEVANLGNARSRVEFALLEEPPDEWGVVLPDPIVLESAAQGGQDTQDTVVLKVHAPSGAFRQQDLAVRLQVVPASTKDPDLTGQQVQIDLHAASQRFAGAQNADAPGVLFLLALLGAALWLRKR